MSNRFLWILIIIWVLGVWYLYYNLSYLPKIKAKELLLIEQKEKIKKEKLIKKVELIKKKKTIINTTNSEKIKELINNEKNYKTFNLNNDWKAYFKKLNWRLDLYYNNLKVWNFDLVYPEYLRVDSVLWKEGNIYIEVWNNKYY